MAKTSSPKQHNVPTTNFVIKLDKININALQEKYQLFTIEIPDYSGKNQEYPKIHNAYREQLDLPYFFYTHAKPKASIFILVEKSKQPEKPISSMFDFLKSEKVVAQEKSITELCTQSNLHILAKLFLSDYFYNHKKNYRICQGKFYIHSRVDKKWATVLEISGLKHIEGTEEFCFDQKATFMVQIEKNKENTQYVGSNVYCELVDGEIYYRQLKTSHVNKLLSDTKSTQNIWKVVTGSPTNKPSIKWFEDYENITRCKSTLLQEFQDRLLKHFNKCFGTDVAKQQIHKMTKLEPIKQTTIKGYGKTGLNINLLGKVGLLDLRFREIEKTNQIPFQQYVDFFNKHYQYSTLKSDFGFVEIKREDLATSKMPILVLQDVEKKLFKPEERDKEGTITQKAGFLFEAGYSDDPKPVLYNEFAERIPLQTMNVNTNEVNEHLLDTYFDYEMLGDCLKHLGKSYKEIGENLDKAEEKISEAYKQEKDKFGEVSEETKNLRKQNEKLKKHFSLVTNKIDVCLNELLLKHYIINQLPIRGNPENPYLYLPCISQIPSLVNFAYMFQNTFMYVDNQYILQFLDLDNPSEKQKRNEFLQSWNINWFEFETQFAERNYTQGNEGKTLNKLKDTHLVFAEGLILAIEDTEERVLHIYDPKKKGQSQRKQEQKTALEGIFYSKEKQLYTVGYTSLNLTADDSVRIRRLHYYQKPNTFKIDDLLQTLSVQFVRNKQYTVYPYFFDLLNLYRKDVKQAEQDE